MATEEPQATGQGVKANVLPPMKFEEVKASAQRILDLRGLPPYTRNTENKSALGDVFFAYACMNDDELRVLSEFVQFWLPFLVQKEKVK